MTQKSGLEMIETLLEKVELLDRRFTVVEQNVKELLSRANGFVPQISNQSDPLPPKLDACCPAICGVEPSITDMEAMNASVMKVATNNAKVMGKIKNQEGKAIIGAQVTIVKENGEVVKQTKTNRAGDWMCFLPPGIYKARYFLDKTINTAVSLNISPEQTIIRVAQPKWG
jgi:hypothetical protein